MAISNGTDSRTHNQDFLFHYIVNYGSCCISQLKPEDHFTIKASTNEEAESILTNCGLSGAVFVSKIDASKALTIESPAYLHEQRKLFTKELLKLFLKRCEPKELMTMIGVINEQIDDSVRYRPNNGMQAARAHQLGVYSSKTSLII